MTAREPYIVPRCALDPTVLYSDDDLLVVDKPAGLLSVPGRHPLNRDCLLARLASQWPDALIVHRLDMDTSGLMVLARNKTSHEALSRQFRERRVSKEYEAVVWGLVSEDEGEIDLPLIADWPNRPLQKVCHSEGKAALTRYRVLHRDAARNRSHLLLEPHTGRSHQLRLHLQALGHPILGDRFYGHAEAVAESTRLLLHATSLALYHPRDGRTMQWRSLADFGPVCGGQTAVSHKL
ncbi:MAG: RluA family pseudouridine synthase [Porticoccaceae bacterium]